MDEYKTSNYVMLRGSMTEPPSFSHESKTERFYRFSLSVSRLSGVEDTIHIIAKQSLLEATELSGEGRKLCVKGELRSFNNKTGIGPRLVITVFARELWLEDGEDENTVSLRGCLCKQPNLRVTPMGREICDLMLAVNRRYGRSDYLPCIAWGSMARLAGSWNTGALLHLDGRIQSRTYGKLVNGVVEEKTAYEVSVIHLETD